MECIENRSKEIVRVSWRGIAVNLVLVAAKAAVGFAAGSLAVILDAVNNLSDAVADLQYVLATTARHRDQTKKVYNADTAAVSLCEKIKNECIKNNIMTNIFKEQ